MLRLPASVTDQTLECVLTVRLRSRPRPRKRWVWWGGWWWSVSALLRCVSVPVFHAVWTVARGSVTFSFLCSLMRLDLLCRLSTTVQTVKPSSEHTTDLADEWMRKNILIACFTRTLVLNKTFLGQSNCVHASDAHSPADSCLVMSAPAPYRTHGQSVDTVEPVNGLYLVWPTHQYSRSFLSKPVDSSLDSTNRVIRVRWWCEHRW